ncbi:hypothetical protein LCGC14_0409990 [marine sediment metagenome]|uniref:Uncharacterized protein n=1 Tax=marine sediment metagenome TaxID=412755 RepID=A0A0F9SU46_9ZZZZ
MAELKVTLHVKRPNTTFQNLLNAFLTVAKQHRLGVDRVDFGPTEEGE